MSIQNRGKINKLIRIWPHGTVAVSSWLNKQGVSRQLVKKYLKSKWLTRIGSGAYARNGESPDWTGGLYAIQSHTGLPIHAAGKTALQLQGYAHFLSLNKTGDIWLFGNTGQKLPNWFKAFDWGPKINYAAVNLFGSARSLSFTTKDFGDYLIRISSPERAVMELLHLAPQDQSLEEARLIMDGLATLRPDLMQELLKECQSIKVKRLFLVLAEASGHEWVPRLDLKKIDLGKGKRLVEKNGKMHPKYQVTVPESLMPARSGGKETA